MTARTNQRIGFRLVALAALLLLATVTAAPARQQVPPDDIVTLETTPVDANALKARIDELRAIGERSESQQAELDLLVQAQSWLVRAQESADQRKAFEADAATADERVAAIEAMLADPGTPFVVDMTRPPSAIDADLQAARAELERHRRLAQQFEADLATSDDRRAAITEERAGATDRRVEVLRLLAEPAAETDSPEVSAARSTRFRTERVAIAERLLRLEVETATADARRKLLRALRDGARHDAGTTEAIVQALLDRSTALQAEQAEARRTSADGLRDEAKSAHPLVAQVLEDAAKRADRLADALTKRAELDTAQKVDNDRAAGLEADFAQIQSQVETAGLTTLIGKRLRAKLDDLPDVANLGRDIRRRRRAFEKDQDDWLELEGSRPGSRNAEATALIEAPIDAVLASSRQALIGAAEPPFSPELEAGLNQLEEVAQVERQRLHDKLHAKLYDALTRRNELRRELVETYDQIFNSSLPGRDQAQLRLKTVAESYADYIAERVLWIRSADRIALSDLKTGFDAMRTTIANREIRSLLAEIAQGVKESPALSTIGGLLLILILVLRRIAWKRVRALTNLVYRPQTDTFAHTVMTLGWTVVIALPVALGFAIVGTLLVMVSGDSPISTKTGMLLLRAGALVFTIDLIRATARENGLGPVHFRWRADASSAIAASLAWFRVIVIPLIFVAAVIRAINDDDLLTTVGRLVQTIFLVSTIVLCQRLLRFNGPIMGPILRLHEGSWLERLRFIWYPALLFIPTALTIATVLGYQYTANVLAKDLVFTAQLVLAFVYLDGLLMRWLLVARRKLALEKRQREIAEAAGTEGAAPPTDESHAVDVETINVQTRRVVRTMVTIGLIIGIAGIWARTLPALGILDGFPLWTTTTTNADGEIVPEVISLAEGLNALVITVITIILSRNLPGVLELTILRRLPFTPSARYAIMTITRYVLAVIGIVLAFNAIGIGWAKVQWLAAAITVGLGFGLQEIFANFVSGLILLFEQPIRVGDTVTVGGVHGTVSRIRIRATTITDWDRKELIIPNRQFVTDQVINWSLSDSLVRIKIKVGIAYGSDTQLAKRNLLRVARETSQVLHDPTPQALFLGFGDSSLDFELRVHVRSIDDYIPTVDVLHNRIDAAFRDHGIEIAFPQRDLHVRSLEVPFKVEQAEGSDRGAAPSAD